MSYSLSLERFIGKVAVVTGASSGIGKAIVEALVKQGIIVAGLARREDRVKDQAKLLQNEKGKLHAYKCDLTKTGEILSTFEKITKNLGPIYILINNAGLVLSTNIIDGDIELWKTILDTNVLAVTVCIREAIKNMKANNITGHIININSTSGHRVANVSGISVYPASKYAVTALTETVRLEINREKLPIKITSLSPGFVHTEFFAVGFGAANAPTRETRKGLEPKDLADATLYLLATPEHVNVKELTVTIQGMEA